MFEFLKILQKRPSDKTILIWRILFWLIIILVLYYNFFLDWENNNQIENVIFWQTLTQNTKDYLKYFIIALWIVPIIMWVSNICITRKKYVRIIQICFGILLFFCASFIKDGQSLDIDHLLDLLWFLPLLAWITWKCITTKCMKYWEKINKIRV